MRPSSGLGFDPCTEVTTGTGENRQVPTVFLATCSDYPDGEGPLLPAALAARGIDAPSVRWDDPTVDWSAADLVAARTTWDYHDRLEEFLAWARSLPVPLMNGAETFAWNADKSYLVPLGAVVPTVPTRIVDLGAPVVVKPLVGAGGGGLSVVRGPLVVQPLVESVLTEGETSVFVFGGRAVSQLDKRPAPGTGEVRVHEEYGGTTVRVELDPARVEVALAAVRAAGAPPYARVDLLRWQGEWVVGELELIEPGLYLDADPVNAEPFADLVVEVLEGRVPTIAGPRAF
jgi:glutathione synthase/RimK-type ligase-like ATP-grasp enzyme